MSPSVPDEVPLSEDHAERVRIHLLLIDEYRKGLEDIAAGRTEDAREALQALLRAHRG